MKYWAAAFILGMLVTSCDKSDLQGDPDILEGTYTTNGLLDFSCALIDPDKLPTLKIVKIKSDTYHLSLTTYIPQKTTFKLNEVLLVDNGTESKLKYNGNDAGTWKYLDGFGKVLNLSTQVESTAIYFVGIKK